MWWKFISANCTSCMGRIDARGGPLPSVAQMEAWFPDPFNVDTWNLNAISNITRRYVVGISDSFPVSPSASRSTRRGGRTTGASLRSLTLNLGSPLRLPQGRVQQRRRVPAVHGRRPSRRTRTTSSRAWASRTQMNDRTVIRGGAGLYYTDVIASSWTHSTRANTTVFLAVDNDGRPDFVTNPFNGPAPNYQQALQRVCDVNTTRVQCVARQQLRGQRTMPVPRLRGTGAARGAGGTSRTAGRASIGVQRQIGRRHVDRRGLRPQPEPRREGPARPGQPRLQPGDGRELSVRGERAEPRVAAVPGVRAGRLLRVHRQVRLSRPADGVDQAVQQPVAGVGNYIAVPDRERRAVAADERNHAGAVPGGAGPGR